MFNTFVGSVARLKSLSMGGKVPKWFVRGTFKRSDFCEPCTGVLKDFI